MALNEDQVLSLSKHITLLPEYHLTGYEKGKGIIQEEAAELACELGDGVIVAGYVERAGDEFYSSAILLDGDNRPLNIRKSEPWGRSEKRRLSGSGHPPAPIDLSIGKTLVILCADAFESRYGARKMAQEAWGGMGVEWVLVPSYWESGLTSS
jgi:predicted amidohydrolase